MRRGATLSFSGSKTATLLPSRGGIAAWAEAHYARQGRIGTMAFIEEQLL